MTTPALTTLEPPQNKQLILAVKRVGIESKADGCPTHGRISLAFCYKDADSDNPLDWNYAFDPGIAKPNDRTYASLYLRCRVYYDPTKPLGKKPTELWMPHYCTGDYLLTEFEIADMAATLARLNGRESAYPIPATAKAYVAMICEIEAITHIQLPAEDGLPTRLVTLNEALYWLDSAIVSLAEHLRCLWEMAAAERAWDNITANDSKISQDTD